MKLMKKLLALFLSVMLVVVGMAVSVSAASLKTNSTDSRTKVSGQLKTGKNNGIKAEDKNRKQAETTEVNGSVLDPADTSTYGSKTGENLDFVNVPVEVEAYGPVELEHVGSGAQNIHGNPAVYFEDSKMHIGVDANVMGHQLHK